MGNYLESEMDALFNLQKRSKWHRNIESLDVLIIRCYDQHCGKEERKPIHALNLMRDCRKCELKKICEKVLDGNERDHLEEYRER